MTEKQRYEMEMQIADIQLEREYARNVRIEVAKEIFAEIQAEIKAALDSNYKALPKVEQSEELWSCVRGKIDCLRGLDDFIDELKKKYTEEDEDA